MSRTYNRRNNDIRSQGSDRQNRKSSSKRKHQPGTLFWWLVFFGLIGGLALWR